MVGIDCSLILHSHSSRRVHFDSDEVIEIHSSQSASNGGKFTFPDVDGDSPVPPNNPVSMSSVGRSASSSNSYMMNNRYTFNFKGRRSVTLQDEVNGFGGAGSPSRIEMDQRGDGFGTTVKPTDLKSLSFQMSDSNQQPVPASAPASVYCHTYHSSDHSRLAHL